MIQRQCGEISREDIIDAAHAGVNNYIVKPFTPQVLRERIEQVMTAGGAV